MPTNTPAHMSDLAALFDKYLPSVPCGTANDFANGMQAYHAEYQKHRSISINHEWMPEYRGKWHEIIQIRQDDYWVYTPYFKQIMGLAINKLFNTKITSISAHCETKPCLSMVLVDEHSNRWIAQIVWCEGSSEKLSIKVRFPMSNTKSHTSATGNVDSWSQPDVKGIILVQDVNTWYEDDEKSKPNE
jgi:hypothetical protein